MQKKPSNIVVPSSASHGKGGGLKKLLVIHGPNLNLLGTREPDIYGRDSLQDINRRLIAQGKAAGYAVTCFQSNQEGALIDRVQAAKKQQIAGIILNPAGYTHTSVALPFVEVHLSNIHAREPFRSHSYFSDLAVGTICGLGSYGYELALQYLLRQG